MAIDDVVVLSQFNEFLRLRLLLFVLVVLLLIKLELLLLLLILGNKLESTGVAVASRSRSTSLCLISSGKLACRSLLVRVRDVAFSRAAVTSSRCSPRSRSFSAASKLDSRLGDSESQSLSSSPGW